MQTQRMYVEHHHRHASVAVNENLADRVLRIGKTLMDLRRKLATEKELLQQEKMMTASMFLLPTTNEYYTLVYPARSEGARPDSARSDASSKHRERLLPEQTYHDGCEQTLCFEDAAENLLDNLSLTSSEKNFIERERKMAMISKIHAYKKHLKDVETKCKLELGQVRESISNLKKVSTELNLEINHGNKKVDKGFFYDEDF